MNIRKFGNRCNRQVTTCDIWLSWYSGFWWNSDFEEVHKWGSVQHETSEYHGNLDFRKKQIRIYPKMMFCTAGNITISWNSGLWWLSRLEYIHKSCFVRHETSGYHEILVFGNILNFNSPCELWILYKDI